MGHRTLLWTFALAGVLSTGHLALSAGTAGTAGTTEKALFSMYCYWTGEATVGRVPGVVRTRIGHFGGEIVEVEYDPAQTDVGKLAAALKRQGSFYSAIARTDEERARALAHLPAAEVKTRRGEPDFIEPKHSLRTRHPELYYLDLTERQAIALNSWSYFGGPMPDVLTPEQKALLARVKARLGTDRPDGLQPARSGRQREEYRRELLAWLGE